MCFDKIAFGMGDWVLWFPTNDTPAMDDALDVCRPMPFPLHVQACAVCFTRSRAPKNITCRVKSHRGNGITVMSCVSRAPEP